jgi:Na+/H+-dicarboxylate symporter
MVSSFKALPRSHRYWVASSALASLFGILIGLYFTPGVALTSPGGAIGRRFGDKTTRY